MLGLSQGDPSEAGIRRHVGSLATLEPSAMKPAACLAPLSAVLLAALLLFGHGAASAEPADALLSHAADDFRQHMKPPPDQFRRVRLGQFTAPDGQTRTVLCGEFKVGARGGWTPFATVQTDPYEQWLGGGAQGFCKAPGFKPTTAQDLSRDLQRQLAAAPAGLSSAPAR